VGRQRARWDKESWLAESQTLPALAGLALARAKDPRGAVLAVERGRAVLLAEALDRDRADLRALRDQGRGDLVDRFEAAMEKLVNSDVGSQFGER
jgi:hypothetical protein